MVVAERMAIDAFENRIREHGLQILAIVGLSGLLMGPGQPMCPTCFGSIQDPDVVLLDLQFDPIYLSDRFELENVRLVVGDPPGEVTEISLAQPNPSTSQQLQMSVQLPPPFQPASDNVYGIRAEATDKNTGEVVTQTEPNVIP